MGNEDTTTPPRRPSRWQRLYSSTFHYSDQTNVEQCLELEDERLSEWLQTIQIENIDPNQSLRIDVKPDKDIVDIEADRIIDYMDVILRDNDDSVIDYVIETENHNDRLIKHHLEKRCLLIVKQWSNFTKAQKAKHQFITDRIDDMVKYHIESSSFKAWNKCTRNTRVLVEEKIFLGMKQRMEYIFNSWVNRYKSQLQELKVYSETVIKMRVLQCWKKTKTQEMSAVIHHRTKIQMRYWRKWMDLNVELNKKPNDRDNTEEKYKEKERRHHLRVSEFMHFMQNDELRGTTNEENPSKEISMSSDTRTSMRSSSLEAIKTNISCIARHQMKDKYESRRLILKQKHIQDKIDRETRANIAQQRKDDEERESYLKQKEEEKKMRLQKKTEIEAMKSAWRLAKLHSKLAILRRCFKKWISLMNESRLLLVKATKFSSNRRLSTCLSFLLEYTKERRQREQANQYRAADQYHNYYILETVLRRWNQFALTSHHHLYEHVMKIRMHHNRCRVINTWRIKLCIQRVRTIEQNNAACKLAKCNKLKWTMRKMRNGVIESKREKKETELIEKKWQQVREWLKK